MPPRVAELLLTAAAVGKLGARSITASEVEQLLWNGPTIVRNRRAATVDRSLLIGMTNGGRCLTLAIEPTVEPSTWLVITGWDSSARERKIIGSS